MLRRSLPLIVALFVVVAPAAGEACAIACVTASGAANAATAGDQACHQHASIGADGDRVGSSSHPCGHDDDDDVLTPPGVTRPPTLSFGVLLLESVAPDLPGAHVSLFERSTDTPRAGPLVLQSAGPLRI